MKLRDNTGDAWASPDGSQIAFVTGDGKQIWVMGANGENPQKVLSGPAGDVFGGLQFLGDRLGYGRLHPAGDHADITVESLDRKTGQVTVAFSDPNITAGVFVPDGRLIYSHMEPPPNQGGFANLWEIRIDPRTGRASGKPRRITRWAGVNITGLSVTADGKHLALQRGLAESDVYVGELEAGRTRLVNPRRLTLDDRNDYASAWTLDGKAVLFSSNRNGPSDIFRQALEQRTAEPVVTSREDKIMARLSPDGAWVIYFAFPGGFSSSPKLMRAPISGGPSEFIVGAPPGADFFCARLPETVCVLSEWHRGQLAFYALDPLRGRGRELLRINVKPLPDYCYDQWHLEPDGSSIAVIVPDEEPARIRVFPLAGGSPRDVKVAGWSGLCDLKWAADGKGWFVSTHSVTAWTHIYVDLQGHSYLLCQTGTMPTFSFPSPDGRHLAFLEWNSFSNVWMLEGF